MLTYENTTEYQIEITTNCNTACPQCPRNINGDESRHRNHLDKF